MESFIEQPENLGTVFIVTYTFLCGTMIPCFISSIRDKSWDIFSRSIVLFLIVVSVFLIFNLMNISLYPNILVPIAMIFGLALGYKISKLPD